MPSARIRVNSHLRPSATSPSPAIEDISVSGHTRHLRSGHIRNLRLQPYDTHLWLSPVNATHLTAALQFYNYHHYAQLVGVDTITAPPTKILGFVK
jgi:hypothetical protein